MAYVVIDTDVCSFLFRRDERAERKHTPISPQDAWIAACAIRHNCPLITHNASDYANISGLTIITEPDV
jgi:tRNA(fMet)-specific endonuclease VapC